MKNGAMNVVCVGTLCVNFSCNGPTKFTIKLDSFYKSINIMNISSKS